MRRLSSFAAVLILTALLGCDNPFSVSAHDVQVQVRGSHLLITNGRDAPITYFFMDRTTSARALWMPCANLACPFIDPGKHVALSLDEARRRRESDQLIVRWWHVVPAEGGGYRPDRIRTLIVRY